MTRSDFILLIALASLGLYACHRAAIREAATRKAPTFRTDIRDVPQRPFPIHRDYL